MFSNQSQLLDNLKDSLRSARLQGFRVLLVLTGNSIQLTQPACDVFSDSFTANTLSAHNDNPQPVTQSTDIIMHLPNLHSNSDISDQINHLLGSENRCVVFDANGSFDERLFAACAGTITAGGLLILQTPNLTNWARPHSSGADTSNTSLFIERLISKLIEHQWVVQPPISTLNTLKPADLDSDSAIIIAAHTDNAALENTLDHEDHLPIWKVEQDLMVRKLSANLLKKSSSICVIQGDRGRGKSALIGRTLHQLALSQVAPHRNISITANRLSACTVTLRHSQQKIDFLSLDKALETTHDVLVVEEAGSIPIPVLQQLIRISQTIIFATTVQGYEGAGRGFAIRFSKILDEINSGWLKLTPTHPIRWSQGDPLEKFVNSALLLEAELRTIPPDKTLSPQLSQVCLIEQSTLASNDNLLEEIYGLLVQAHYQTTPADLRNMLDKSKLLVFAQRTDNVLTGAALVALEGEIPVDLHTAIVQKKRRLPDQILPQLLAQSAAEPSVLSCRFARIVRIAVHPALHNRGFGSELYKQLTSILSAQTTNIGASFGADEQSLSFWCKQGLVPIHYGHRANPRSGLRSACLISQNSIEVTPVVDFASTVLRLNLSALIRPGDQLNPVIDKLISTTARSEVELSDKDTSDLINDFCQTYRSFIDTAGLLLDNKSLASSSRIKAEVHSIIAEYAQMPPKTRRSREQNLRALLIDAIN